MKKRSALTIAGMLVAALLAGAVSMSLGAARGDVSPTGTTAPVEPRVRTVERTITIHKKAKSDAPAVVKTIPAPAPAASNAVAASAPSAPAGYDDDAYEGDDTYEDDDEGDDHEDDGDSHEDDDSHEDEGEDD